MFQNVFVAKCLLQDIPTAAKDENNFQIRFPKFFPVKVTGYNWSHFWIRLPFLVIHVNIQSLSVNDLYLWFHVVTDITMTHDLITVKELQGGQKDVKVYRTAGYSLLLTRYRWDNNLVHF